MTQDEQLTVDLWLLDALLTGRDPRSGRGDEDKLVSMEKFAFGELYYLSDGGYSRVFFSQAGTLGLSSESRVQVRERWYDHSTGQICHRITQRVKDYLRLA